MKSIGGGVEVKRIYYIMYRESTRCFILKSIAQGKNHNSTCRAKYLSLYVILRYYIWSYCFNRYSKTPPLLFPIAKKAPPGLKSRQVTRFNGVFSFGQLEKTVPVGT